MCISIFATERNHYNCRRDFSSRLQEITHVMIILKTFQKLAAKLQHPVRMDSRHLPWVCMKITFLKYKILFLVIICYHEGNMWHVVK